MAKSKTVKVINEGGMPGYAFFVAWLGALVYFAQQSEGFSGFVIAILKSLVWPAYIVHSVLGVLGI